MNPLLIVLGILLLSGRDLSSVAEFISKIDVPSFAPVLRLLGIDERTIEVLCDEEFSSAFSKGTDLKTLLPSLLRLLNKKKGSPDNDEPAITVPKDLSPIEDIAPTEIESDIENALKNG